MYLGLLLDAVSKQKIAACLPSSAALRLPTDLHITLIHTSTKDLLSCFFGYFGEAEKEREVASGYRNVIIPRMNELLPPCVLPIEVAPAGDVEVFGPPGKEQMVLTLEKDYTLGYLRGRAEGILISLGCAWSKEWDFNPHISIGQPLSSADVARLKSEIMFYNLSCDRLEWAV